MMLKIYTTALLFCALILYAQKPISKFSISSTGGNVLFSNETTGTANNYLWTFSNGTPASSTAVNPTTAYAGQAPYIAKLMSSNASGSSTLEKTITTLPGTIIDLSTGRNDDGSLMSTASVADNDWTVTNSTNVVSIPTTRATYTG